MTDIFFQVRPVYGGKNTYIVYAEKLVIEKKAVFTDPLLLLLLGKRKTCYGQICVRKLLVFPKTFSKKSPHVPFNYLQNNPSFPVKTRRMQKGKNPVQE